MPSGCDYQASVTFILRHFHSVRSTHLQPLSYNAAYPSDLTGDTSRWRLTVFKDELIQDEWRAL